ncbi:MAG: SDR family oxidoreductase [Candidatus Helarchaeota archaeon]
MDLKINNKNVLVTASSKGIGKAIAKGFVLEGCNVAICARNEDILNTTTKELQSLTKKKVISISCDLSVLKDIDKLSDFVLENFSSIDILINNSGGPPSGKFNDFTIDNWRKAYELNLRSIIYLCKKIIPYMKKKNWGRIINLTSISVKQPLDNLILSNVFRSGVVGLTKSLSNELAPFNILVNSVCPGYTYTERVKSLSERIAKDENIPVEDVIKRWIRIIPLGRLATPEEIANLVIFLGSEKASYITGTTISVDGGFVKSLL